MYKIAHFSSDCDQRRRSTYRCDRYWWEVWVGHISVIFCIFLRSQGMRPASRFVEASGFLPQRDVGMGQVMDSVSPTFIIWKKCHVQLRCGLQACNMDSPRACCINRTLFRFLISHLVPNGVPTRCIETLASTRSDPCLQSFVSAERNHRPRAQLTFSMSPSLAPSLRRMDCSFLMKDAACAGDLQCAAQMTLSSLPSRLFEAKMNPVLHTSCQLLLRSPSIPTPLGSDQRTRSHCLSEWTLLYPVPNK
jgi:hypothetical protein